MFWQDVVINATFAAERQRKNSKTRETSKLLRPPNLTLHDVWNLLISCCYGRNGLVWMPLVRQKQFFFEALKRTQVRSQIPCNVWRINLPSFQNR